MSESKARQERQEAANERMELCMHLAEYWFQHEHPNWSTQLSEDEEVEQIKERFLRIQAFDDAQLEQLRLATVREIMRQSPLRKIEPKKQRSEAV